MSRTIVLVYLISLFGIFVQCQEHTDVDAPPPEVLISTQSRSQSQRRVVFTFEWNQDVSDKFTSSDVVITDSKNRRLKFRSWTTATKNSNPISNDNYYGDGIFKVDAMTAPYSPGRKFFGVVVAPSKGWVEAIIPTAKVCVSVLCNGMSSPVRVHVNPDLPECVRVSSTAVESDGLTIPLTFDFAEDVAAKSFKRKHFRAFVYSRNKILSDVRLRVSKIIGGPRRFFATVEGINDAKLPLLEVWVRGEKVRRSAGGRFCESNHHRLKFSKKAFVNAEKDVAPQNRQFVPLTLLQGLPPVMQALPLGFPSSVAPIRSSSILRSSSMGLPVATAGHYAHTNNFADESISSVKLSLNSIQTPNIHDGAVTGVKLANNAVDTNALHEGAITEQKLGNFAIDTRSLADEAVTAKKINFGVVPVSMIGQDALDAGSIATGAVQGYHIDNGGVQLGAVGDAVGKLKDPNMVLDGKKLGDITSNKIADGAVTPNKLNKFLTMILTKQFDSGGIAESAVEGKHLAFGSVTPLKLANGAVMGNDIDENAVTIEKIANEAVNTAALMDGAVAEQHIPRSTAPWGEDDIKDRSVLVNKLDPRVISQFGLSSNVVTTEMIVNRNINARSIGEDAVTSLKFGEGGVEARDLAYGSVSRDKLKALDYSVITDTLGDLSVIGSNIANDVVSSNSLASDSVTTLRIGDAAVDTIHLDDGIVTRLKVGEQAVGSNHLVDGSVTNNKVGDGTVTNNALGGDSVTFKKIMPIAIIGPNIQDGVIANKFIGDSAVDSEVFSSDAITTNKLVDLAIQKDNLAKGAVTEQALADNTITKDMLQNSAVYGENYGKSSITEVPDGSVLGIKIADGGIGAGDIVPNAIDRSLVKPLSITNNGFEEDAITAAKFADASVTTKKVKEKGVDANEIADLAITAAKFGKASVPGFGIADAQITNNHMQDKAVTARSLDPNAVSPADIFSVLPTVDSTYLADGSIATANLKDYILQNGKFVDNTVTSENIQTSAISRTGMAKEAVMGPALADASVLAANIDTNQPVVSTDKLKDGGVENRHVEDDAVTTKKFGAGTVHSDAYDDQIIDRAHLSSDFLLAGRILGNASIQTSHIQNDAVIQAKVGPKSVQENALTSGSVAADHIADNSGISRHFANKSVTTNKLDGVILIDTLQFADRSLDGPAFADGSITATKVNDAIADGEAFADGGIVRINLGYQVVSTRVVRERGISVLESEGVGKFARNSIKNAHIVDGAVDADAIADGAVSPAHMQTKEEWVTQRYVADGGFKNAAFAPGSVTSDKLVNFLVSADIFAGGNVTSDKISPFDDITRVVADDTVYEPNFADGAITSEHIVDGAVVEGKIGEGVNTAAIPDNGIDAIKIPSDGFTNYSIKNLTLTGTQLQDEDLVTTAKIADFGVTVGKIAPGAITGPKIKEIGGIISQPFKEHSMDENIVQLDGFVVTAPKYMNKSLEDISFVQEVATANTIADGGVSGDNFAAGSTTAAKITAPINSGKLADNSFGGGAFALGTIETENLADRSVTGDKVKAGSLEYGVIIETGIDNEKFADDAFDHPSFADDAFTLDKVDFSSMTKVVLEDSVTEFELKDGGIETDDIADGAVSNAKLQSGIVNVGQYGGVKADNFAVGSISEDKITDASVGKGPTSDQDGIAFRSHELGAEYISDGAIIQESTLQEYNVGGDVFSAGAFTSDHIADGVAAGSDFATGAVTSAKVVDNVIEADGLVADAITTGAKFANGAVTNNAVREQTIGGSKFANGALNWNNTLASVFTQASEANRLIDLVGHTVAAIDPRCSTGAKPTSHRTHTLAASTHGMRRGRSMEDHHEFCARRGLGKATKVANDKPHPFHVLSRGKQLSGASSISPSVGFFAIAMGSFLVQWL